jgi:26S proteasome non-ATPase regulatory subunit 9
MDFAFRSGREKFNQLSAQREALEAEADAIHSELTSPGENGEPPAGIKDSVIDAEGYPRGDIDIFRVKNQRRRLAELNTDFKVLMKELEQVTIQLHQAMPSAPSQPKATPTPAATAAKIESTVPIARLDEVLAGSPAALAGILNGDLLINVSNHVETIVMYLFSVPMPQYA